MNLVDFLFGAFCAWSGVGIAWWMLRRGGFRLVRLGPATELTTPEGQSTVYEIVEEFP